jgi:hypothetical protein
MKTWFKDEWTTAQSLLRRPGAGMAILGYLLARMSLQADLYVPDWLAGTVLTPAVFWIGEAMVAIGLVWFVVPEIKRLFSGSREHSDLSPGAAAASSPVGPVNLGGAD